MQKFLNQIKCIFYLFAIFLLIMVSACTNPMTPKEKNFKKAINSALKQTDNAYVPVNLGPFVGNDNKGGPFVEALLKQKLIQSIDPYKEEEKRVEFGGFHNRMYLKTTLYEPTDFGKSYLEKTCNFIGLCYYRVKVGVPEVVKINHFTPPVEKDGRKVTQVEFSYQVKTFPWLVKVLTEPGLDEDFKKDISKELGNVKNPLIGNMLLHLTEKGWVAEKSEVK